MKKVLLATSFLVAGAGFAAAEVAVSGDGRMGIVYNGDEVNFSSRARVGFTLTGETDTGLSFGGFFRAHQAEGAASGSNGHVFVSGAFGRIEMGDTVGAAEAVLFDLPEVGYTDFSNNDTGFLTGDSEDYTGSITQPNNPSLLYTYSMDAFTFALSFTDGVVDQGVDEDNQAFALGVNYTAGDYTVGLAYEQIDVAGDSVDPSVIWLGGTAAFGETTVSAIYGSFDDADKEEEIGLGLASSFNGVGIAAFAKRESFVGGVDVDSYGLGGSYDLGGGASVVGGIADSDAWEDARADLGLKFKF